MEAPLAVPRQPIFPALNRKQKFSLCVAYASYSIVVLYPIVMFDGVASLGDDTYLALASKEEKVSPGFFWSWRIFVAALAMSDAVINFIVINPTDLTNESNQVAELQEEDILYNLSLARRNCVRRSLFLTVGIGYFSFITGSLSTMLALAELGAGEIGVIVLGSALTFLGAVFYHLLSADDLIKHHKAIYGDLAQPCSERKCKPSLASLVFKAEAFLQISSNAFFRAISFAYFVVGLLTYFACHDQETIRALAGLTAFSSFYGSVFTRSLTTWRTFDKASQTPLQLKNVHSIKSFIKMAVSATRTAGIVYVLARFLPKEGYTNIILSTLAAMFLSAHSISVACEKNEAQQIAGRRSQGAFKFLTTANALARILRIFAVAQFILTLSAALRGGQNPKAPLSILDAFMISFACLGVEANNFSYYQPKLKKSLEDMSRKYELHKKILPINKKTCSITYFFTRSLAAHENAAQSNELTTPLTMPTAT